VENNKQMELRKINQQIDVERRYASTDGLELRNADTGQSMLKGYALRFGSTYDMGWFTEEISRSALDNADLTDVRILFNHDPNQILGRTSANTARVGIDSTGLWYEVDLPNSPNGQNARVAVERGDVSQSSWGFMLNRSQNESPDKWEMRDGKEHRTITDVKKVLDASPVTFPANPDTTIAKRSFDMQKRTDGEMELPSPSEIFASIISEAAECIDECNECIECCQGCIDNADTYIALDPMNSDLYVQMKTNCQASIDACKVAIQTHTEIIAAANGKRNKTENNNFFNSAAEELAIFEASLLTI
jgi:HK97 family phage prohead protease